MCQKQIYILPKLGFSHVHYEFFDFGMLWYGGGRGGGSVGPYSMLSFVNFELLYVRLRLPTVSHRTHWSSIELSKVMLEGKIEMLTKMVEENENE